MRRLAIAALAALLLLVPSTAIATQTEVDAVSAVIQAWVAEPDPLNNEPYLEELVLLYPDASLACQLYIDHVFSALAIFEVSNRLAPDVEIGRSTFDTLVANAGDPAYACLIAV